jgi:hypothetical protein
MSRGPLKVLHLPSSVGGNAWGLSRGERELGLDSRVMIANQNWINYQADISLGLERTPGKAAKLIKLAAAFMSVRNKYDVFHFNAGSSLIHSPQNHLNQFELPFYPGRAKLFVTYNGCDARQKFPTIGRTKISACHNPRCYHGMCNYGAYDELRRRAIGKMNRYVRHMWALNPDLLHFLPSDRASFLPYTVSCDGLTVAAPRFDGKLKIVHAPTNREAKGSDFVMQAVDKLRQTHGGLFELVLVENMPHQEALAVYRAADLVIDQVLIGWYGALAVETMKMGKPVIARVAREDLRFLPPQMAHDVIEAVIEAEPGSLYEVLLRCVEDREFLRRHSAAALEYVHRWHAPRFVAGLTQARYEAA